MAMVERRLIPARAVYHLVWAPACQDLISGCHAGVGVIGFGGAPLAAPSIATLSSRSSTGMGGVVHLL